MWECSRAYEKDSDETYRKVEERRKAKQILNDARTRQGKRAEQLDTTMKRIERLRNLAEETKGT